MLCPKPKPLALVKSCTQLYSKMRQTATKTLSADFVEWLGYLKDTQWHFEVSCSRLRQREGQDLVGPLVGLSERGWIVWIYRKNALACLWYL